MTNHSVGAEILWEPSAERMNSSGLSKYTAWLTQHRARNFSDYEALRQWSIADLDGFWGSLWDYFEIISDQPYDQVLEERDNGNSRWFTGSKTNYAEHILRHEEKFGDRAALIHLSEIRPRTETSWLELGEKVRSLATSLRALGVEPGDRVVAYLPNIEETVVALLATVSIGAIWAVAPPEFGVPTVIDRFSQIKPKVLIATDGYCFGGKTIDRRRDLAQIVGALDSLEHVIHIPYIGLGRGNRLSVIQHEWIDILNAGSVSVKEFRYERVGSDHPLWILFSSGTTGLPKPIVHSHIGIIIEHLKNGALHTNSNPETISFFYTTTGWMLFNTLVSVLLQGATAVLYDGSPSFPDIGKLWSIADTTGATITGASPGLVEVMAKHGYVPKTHHDLSRIRTLLTSGAPASPETFRWLHENVTSDVVVASLSGGTELCGALVGTQPWAPVQAGRIQCRQLGMAVEAWSDDGTPIRNAPGELVVTRPFPSMPLMFWNDKDSARYKSTYFETFPGVWHHGDLISIFDDGSCFIHGRSDATLNRHGVRIGTAEIYRTIDQLDFIEDGLAVCAPGIAGPDTLYLFVSCPRDVSLSSEMCDTLKKALRSKNSPRHVPDVIEQAPSIPYTLTGKRMEVPVKRLLLGIEPAKVAKRGSMSEPTALDWYVAYRRLMHETTGA